VDDKSVEGKAGQKRVLVALGENENRVGKEHCQTAKPTCGRKDAYKGTLLSEMNL